MKATVWGINYAPELTGIAPYNKALCEHLQEAGHEVEMVTGFAYYPAWKKQEADRGKLYRSELLGGVAVHRCWQYVPGKTSTLKRIMHEASFVCSSFLRILALRAPDVYVVVSPPLLLGAAAWLLGKLKRRPFVFHVQDLQPDAAAGLGMLKGGRFIRALYGLESFAYRKAARVSGIMPGMIEAFRRKGVPPEKTVLFPNGVVLPDLNSAPPRGKFRARYGFAPTDFLAVYSGNLGMKQGLDVLVKAASHVKDPAVRIVICGEGAQRAHLTETIARQGLKNVTLLPLQPDAEYREMLVDTDVSVITQQAGSGGFFFPSKLLTTLAWQKPVLTVADEESELVQALKGGGFGINVPPGNAEAVIEALQRLAGDREQLAQFATAGRNYVSQFAMSRVLNEFTLTLERLASERAAKPALKVAPAVASNQ